VYKHSTVDTASRMHAAATTRVQSYTPCDAHAVCIPRDPHPTYPSLMGHAEFFVLQKLRSGRTRLSRLGWRRGRSQRVRSMCGSLVRGPVHRPARAASHTSRANFLPARRAPFPPQSALSTPIPPPAARPPLPPQLARDMEDPEHASWQGSLPCVTQRRVCRTSDETLQAVSDLREWAVGCARGKIQ